MEREYAKILIFAGVASTVLSLTFGGVLGGLLGLVLVAIGSMGMLAGAAPEPVDRSSSDDYHTTFPHPFLR
jgi:hypothetical protein